MKLNIIAGHYPNRDIGNKDQYKVVVVRVGSEWIKKETIEMPYEHKVNPHGRIDLVEQC